ncbi:MAG: helix-turn-helix domain-containing protein [Candidatus Aramenus sp.]|jgi:uncharacterized membrane protein|nr:helix-turn-helix domain-containing protein [Candidatus Aramenus sp.]
MKSLLTLIALALAAFTVTVSHSSTLVVFYNGTVVANISGESRFLLVGHNVTPIRVSGSSFSVQGGVVYFSNKSNVTISYVASFSKGVISLNEPYPLNITLYLPSASTVTYMSPVPDSFSLQGGYYKLSFYSDNVTVLYYLPPAVGGSTSSQPNYNMIYTLLAVLVGLNGFFAFSIVKLLRARVRTATVQVPEAKEQPKEKEAEEGKEEQQSEGRLNDRDLLVLEAINKGNYTLSDIMKFTKLPKTTTYRRVKKLVSLGYVEEVKKEGRTFYVPKNRSGTSS